MKPRRKKPQQQELWQAGQDLPLFSGHAQDAPTQRSQAHQEEPQASTSQAQQLTTDTLPQIVITYTKGQL